MLKAAKLKSNKNNKTPSPPKKAKPACCVTTHGNAMECNFHVRGNLSTINHSLALPNGSSNCIQ